LPGQQAGPQVTYPAGQAEAEVAAPSAADISANAVRIRIATICLSRNYSHDGDKNLVRCAPV